MSFISPCIRFYEKLICFGEFFQSLILLALRLVAGYGLHVAGCAKFDNIGNVAGFFHKLGIIMPEYSAYLVASVECVGGILLLVGFASRLVSIPLAITMIVALLTAHAGATFALYPDIKEFMSQAPVPYLMAALAVFGFGPGSFSVDYVLERFRAE